MERQENSYKIYLDVCCLNRPFDDWNQERVRWEGEAVLSIMEHIYDRKWQLISSEAIEVELERMRDLEKLENVLKLLEFATIKVNLNDDTIEDPSN